jgi:hypothetical protein
MTSCKLATNHSGRDGFNLWRFGVVLSIAMFGQMSWGDIACAAEGADGEATPAAVENVPVPLAETQEALALRYQRFEATLQQLQDTLRKTDPSRAELLIRAIGKSKEGRIPDQMQQLVKLLKNDQLGDAIERQTDLAKQLQGLLELLQSEDRKDELARERDRIAGILKDLNKTIAKEMDLRAATERREDADRLAAEQEKIAKQTGSLAERIEAPALDEGKEGNKGKQEPSEKSAPEKPASEKGPSENENADKADPDQMETPPGESPEAGPPSETPAGKPKPAGKPQSGTPPAGKPMGESPESESGESQSGEEQSANPKESQPGQKEVEAAKERLERAIEELKKKKHAEASNEQDAAIAELLKAKEKLEQILRQLREEERELVLQALETRLRDMLTRQGAVYAASISLNRIPADQQTDRHRGRSIELGRQQEEIVLDASKTLLLLKEEASSVAFPQAIEEIRADMVQVARRFAQVDVSESTLAIEKEIIEALEELVEALQAEIEKQKDKGEQKAGQPSPPQEPGLVNQIAELKMLRSLQYRINRRTKRLGREVEGESADRPDLVQQLKELSARQNRIQKATYDLSIGRNK